MAVAYRIANWDKHYEVSQTRRVQKNLSWVAVPTKHDGLGYRKIMSMPNGISIYGAWVLLVQIAAKCPNRGILADDTGPLTPEDLSLKTGCPADVFEEALAVFTDPKIGWVERVTTSLRPGSESGGSAVCLQDRTGQDNTGQDKEDCTEQAGAAPVPTNPLVLEFPTNGKAKCWGLRQSKFDEYAESFPGVDLDAELRKALQWCRDNPSKRKTPQGMPSFLSRWLSNAQNSTRGSPVTKAEGGAAAWQEVAKALKTFHVHMEADEARALLKSIPGRAGEIARGMWQTLRESDNPRATFLHAWKEQS